MKITGCLPKHQIIWRATLTSLTVHNAPKFRHGRRHGIIVGHGALSEWLVLGVTVGVYSVAASLALASASPRDPFEFDEE